jgi:hypothetical protein
VEQLTVIERFLSLVLALSVNETCNIAKKTVPGNDFLTFMAKMKEIIRNASFTNEEINQYKAEALSKLEQIEMTFESQNMPVIQKINRTNWLKPLIKDDGTAALLGEEIVHLCYNYTVEDSINNVSKAYESIEHPSFAEDVVKKLTIFWERYGQVEHDTDQDDIIEYPTLQAKRWKKTAEIAGYDSNSKVVGGDVPCDEKAEIWRWRWVFLLKTGKAGFFAFVYFLLFCGAEAIVNVLQDEMNFLFTGMDVNFLLQNMFSIVFFGIIASLIAKVGHIPDVLECLQDIVRHFMNIFVVWSK